MDGPSVRVRNFGNLWSTVNQGDLYAFATWHRQKALDAAASVCDGVGRSDLADLIRALPAAPPIRPTLELPEYITTSGQAVLLEAYKSATRQVTVKGGRIKVGVSLAAHGLLLFCGAGKPRQGQRFELTSVGAEVAKKILVFLRKEEEEKDK